jgi:hypothetical protein
VRLYWLLLGRSRLLLVRPVEYRSLLGRSRLLLVRHWLLLGRHWLLPDRLIWYRLLLIRRIGNRLWLLLV